MSSARTRPRLLTVPVALGLLAGFVLAAPAPPNVLAEGPPPTFSVTVRSGTVQFFDWPAGG
jgi:hypothetical protein